MKDRQKEGSHTKSEVYRSVSVWRTCNTPPPRPDWQYPSPHTHPLELHSIQYTQRTQKELQRCLMKYVQKHDKYITRLQLQFCIGILQCEVIRNGAGECAGVPNNESAPEC